MEHCIKSVFLLILVLLFTGPCSGETVLPSEQVQKVAESAADLDNGVNHANPKGRKVKMQPLLFTLTDKKNKQFLPGSLVLLC